MIVPSLCSLSTVKYGSFLFAYFLVHIEKRLEICVAVRYFSKYPIAVDQ